MHAWPSCLVPVYLLKFVHYDSCFTIHFVQLICTVCKVCCYIETIPVYGAHITGFSVKVMHSIRLGIMFLSQRARWVRRSMSVPHRS